MLIKSEKGRHELRPGNRSLGQRERAVLLLIDGKQPEEGIGELFGGEGRKLIDQLLQQEFIQRINTQATSKSTPAEPKKPPVSRSAPAPAPEPIHGDPIHGTPSLASARMFLFDISERLFAPRNKALAQHYRDALREARDGATMLAVGRQMLVDVEVLAGPERADGISQRLSRLLPQELVETLI
ncbi:MAG: hypothetical protein U1D25_11775 [Hydrogenophaga sp.]|uniref:hypothetical protein n=1 Tax=Hydrogenophaga sp. TaxID=1904254 RepID=UPI0027694CEC|nr:hypothetical protein [Hydrogenophaga sp.]MDP2419121.1 hypothetical protein [Hydrogenophaga sp.]MDZ4188771.1 hypothetical protein [Hydrogenophaga sp.]